MNIPDHTVEARLRAALALTVSAREENALPGGSRDTIEACLENVEVELVAALDEAGHHAR
jgi:hypothetical protein